MAGTNRLQESHRRIRNRSGDTGCDSPIPDQNSKYPPVPVARASELLWSAGSKATTPRNVSHADWVSEGSAPTTSRIMFQAARLRAPSGGGPMANATEHCGQKQIRCAADFCRGLTPTVCANMYTETDLWPASSSRLQRRQDRFSKRLSLAQIQS